MGVLVDAVAHAKVSSLVGAAMDVRIPVETTFGNGERRTHQLDGISRPYRITCPVGFVLRLKDVKMIVGHIRKAIQAINKAIRQAPRV